MSRFFASGSQSTGTSASASVLPMNIQGWFPLGLTGLISLQSKRLSRVFSRTTNQDYLEWEGMWALGSQSRAHCWLLLVLPDFRHIAFAFPICKWGKSIKRGIGSHQIVIWMSVITVWYESKSLYFCLVLSFYLCFCFSILCLFTFSI